MGDVELWMTFMMLLLTAFWIVQGSVLFSIVALLGVIAWYFNYRQS